MFISHKYKVIFIHIQKNGGTSIERAFEESDAELVKSIRTSSSERTLRHCVVSDVRVAIDDNIFKNYKKFSVVRNPFDRMVSWYSMFKQKAAEIDASSQPSGFKAMGDGVMAEVNRNADSFKAFLMLPRNHESGLFERFYVNQLDYISENGRILTDKILRFENLAGDFNTLAKEIGFKAELPHVNKSAREKNYRTYYDDMTKELMFQRFKKDFEYFGYRF